MRLLLKFDSLAPRVNPFCKNYQLRFQLMCFDCHANFAFSVAFKTLRSMFFFVSYMNVYTNFDSCVLMQALQ